MSAFEKDDGYRFIFIDGDYCETTIMKDTLGEFPPLRMPQHQAEILSKMLREQHILRAEKGNRYARVNSFIDLIRENSDLDKDVLIACINASIDFIDHDERS